MGRLDPFSRPGAVDLIAVLGLASAGALSVHGLVFPGIAALDDVPIRHRRVVSGQAENGLE